MTGATGDEPVRSRCCAPPDNRQDAPRVWKAGPEIDTKELLSPMTDDGDALHLSGGIPLGGTVKVRGSENAVPKLMVAALLTEEPVVIHNISQIVDTWLVSELVELLGCSTAQPADGQMRIEARNVHTAATRDLEYFHVRSRIPVLTCAPFLHRTGHAEVWKPGGCSIGERPVDLHLEVLRAFGAVSERTDTSRHSVPRCRYSLSAWGALLAVSDHEIINTLP
jgi:UDP-N-acetylglucosamine enolpyruvyl transferase